MSFVRQCDVQSWSHSWSLRSVAQRRVTVPGLCRGLHARDGIVRIRANTVNIGTPTPLDRSRRRQARRASRRIGPLHSNAGKPGEASGRLLGRPARRRRGWYKNPSYLRNDRECGELRGGRRMAKGRALGWEKGSAWTMARGLARQNRPPSALPAMPGP